MTHSRTLHSDAEAVLKLLQKRKLRIVLAESCTGGLVAAAFTGIPGASKVFCGSQVVYRDLTKQHWLGVPEHTIKTLSAVSPKVARLMVTAILRATREAHIAAAITGHLGPKAPRGMDGLIYISVAVRAKKKSQLPLTFVNEIFLPRAPRLERQYLASHSLMEMVRSLLSLHSESKK